MTLNAVNQMIDPVNTRTRPCRSLRIPDIQPPTAAASRDEVAIRPASLFEKCHAAIRVGKRNAST
jgi:hypothetical protein